MVHRIDRAREPNAMNVSTNGNTKITTIHLVSLKYKTRKTCTHQCRNKCANTHKRMSERIKLLVRIHFSSMWHGRYLCDTLTICLTTLYVYIYLFHFFCCCCRCCCATYFVAMSLSSPNIPFSFALQFFFLSLPPSVSHPLDYTLLACFYSSQCVRVLTCARECVCEYLYDFVRKKKRTKDYAKLYL